MLSDARMALLNVSFPEADDEATIEDLLVGPPVYGTLALTHVPYWKRTGPSGIALTAATLKDL